MYRANAARRASMPEASALRTLISALYATVAIGIFHSDFFRIGAKTCCKFLENAYKYSTCVSFVERGLLDEIDWMNGFNKQSTLRNGSHICCCGSDPNRQFDRLRRSQRFTGPPPTLFGGRSVAKKKSAKKGAKKAAKKGTKKKGAKKKKKSAKKM